MNAEQKKAKLVEYRKSSPRCIFIKKDGTRCKGIASKATNMCPVHSGFVPALARKRVDLTVSNDLLSLKKFLCEIAMQVQRGKMQPLQANSLSNTARVLIEIEEKLTLDGKLDKLMAMVQQFKNSSVDDQDLRALESEFDTEQ